MSVVSILEEVMGRGTEAVIYFSPDGRYITYPEFNDENVKEIKFMYYGDTTNQYPQIITIPYPKVSHI